MTTAWQIPPDLWAGETVAVIVDTPSLSPALLQSARLYKMIAVRRAFELVPDADMLVALDGPSGSLDDEFWEDARDFQGLKVCGLECDVDALYPGLMYERIEIGPNHTIEIRNNGLAGIRLAAQGGAAKIRLFGFDVDRYEAEHAHTGFWGLKQGLDQIMTELRGRGIEIEHVELGSPVVLEDVRGRR